MPPKSYLLEPIIVTARLGSKKMIFEAFIVFLHSLQKAEMKCHCTAWWRGVSSENQLHCAVKTNTFYVRGSTGITLLPFFLFEWFAGFILLNDCFFNISYIYSNLKVKVDLTLVMPCWGILFYLEGVGKTRWLPPLSLGPAGSRKQEGKLLVASATAKKAAVIGNIKCSADKKHTAEDLFHV